VNSSDWDCTLENDGGFVGERIHKRHAEMKEDIRSTHAVRLGFRQVKGFSKEDAERIMERRGKGYDSVRDLWLRTGLSRAVIERLADADAFRSLGLDRRDALWAARGLGGDRDRLPLLDAIGLADIRREPDFALPPMPLGEHVVNDYRYLSLSLKAHPVGFLRQTLAGRRVVPTEALSGMKTGMRVTVSGLVLIRQRPGTAKGVIFMTLEDETGIANVIVWARTFERFRPIVLGARLVAVTGPLQHESGVIHVVAEKIEDLSPMLLLLSEDGGDLESLARADELKRGPTDDSRDRGKAKKLVRLAKDEPGLLGDLARQSADTESVMPKGRNFH
jgi:error-prone DNA polymerase